MADNITNTNSSSEIFCELVKKEQNYVEYRIWTDANPIIDMAEERIKTEAAELEMAGFQKGKVPPKIARKHIGEKVLSSIIDRKIAQMLQYAIKSEDLKISSPPGIEVEEFEKDKALKCYVKFEVIDAIPDIDLSDPRLQNKVEVLSLEVTPEDIEKAMTALQGLSSKFSDTEEGYQVQNGDKLVIDFDGRVDSAPFQDGSGAGVEIVLGTGQFIDGFEQQLIGMKAGESKIFKTTFPEDYHVSELANKEGVFKVVVHSIQKAESTTFDDEFAKSLGLDSAKQFEEMIGERLRADFSFLSRLLAKKQLFELVDEIIPMEVPPKMIEVDFKSLWAEVLPKIPKDNLKGTQEEMAIKVMDIARRRVKLGLILAEIAKKYSIEVTESDLEESKQIEIMRNPTEAKSIEEQYSDKRNRPKIEAAALEEKVITFVLDCLTNIEKTITSDQFNNEYAQKLQDII